MTKRDFFQNVLNAHINAEIDDFCTTAIENLDKTNSKRRTSASAKRAEVNEPIKVALYNLLTDVPQPASDLGAKAEVTTAKASALLRALVNDGKVKVTEVKGKSGKVQGYYL
jgi:hypothetical protein